MVSALALNFVPDPLTDLAEMRRVARPDGLIAGYVWDYAEGMDMIRAFWDVLPSRRGGSGSVRVHLPEGRPPRCVKWRFVIAVALGVLAAMFLAPELFGLAEVPRFAPLVAFRPAAAVGLLVSAVLVVLVRRRWWPGALAVWVVAAVVLGMVVPRAIAGPAPGPGRTLTLLSFNVYEGHADVLALARIIHTARPDVIVLPEAGERYRQLLMPQVANLGYRSWTTEPPDSEDVNGIVVLAAPWLGAVTAEPLPYDTKFRWMQVTGGALGTVRVVAVHVAAPVPELTQDWTSELGMLQQW